MFVFVKRCMLLSVLTDTFGVSNTCFLSAERETRHLHVDALQTVSCACAAHSQLYTPRLSRNFRLLLEISVQVDGGLE
jgi:hypothetical protein